MILQLVSRRTTPLCHVHLTAPAVQQRLQSTTAWKPLRLLFCGSDEFSCASLRAVHKEMLSDPESIASIDVLLRPGKPSGRGMKSFREVPIKRVASELSLPIHERDTFTGWILPRSHGQPINLIVAVSFGLFVPPRILKSAEYGGINLHPSLLPDFHGAAPLQHTLLAGETHTGVTLQTLHPEKFDHGKILAQTPPPGLEIPNASECTYKELLEFISPNAAEMLVKGIRNRLFLPEVAEEKSSITGTGNSSTTHNSQPLRHAPKISPEDKRINWKTMTAEEILRRDRVLGRLWSDCLPKRTLRKTRVIFEGLKSVSQPEEFANGLSHEVLNTKTVGFLPIVSENSSPELVPFIEQKDGIVLPAANGGAILVKELTVEGHKKRPAIQVLPELQ